MRACLRPVPVDVRPWAILLIAAVNVACEGKRDLVETQLPITLDGGAAKAVVVAGVAFENQLKRDAARAEQIVGGGRASLDTDLAMYSVAVSRDATAYRVWFRPKRLFQGASQEFVLGAEDYSVKKIVLR